MTTVLKTLETTGFIDESGQLHINEPIDMPPTRVRVSLLMLDEELDDKRIWSAEQAFDIFVQKVKDTDIVCQVLLVGEGIETTIYTVTLSLWEQSEARTLVYDAESEVVRAMSKPLVDFQIVNLESPSELSSNMRVKNLRSRARASWKRSDNISG